MCFNNLIALKGSCNDATLPTDGMRLNTLGVTREFCENIINSDYADVDEFVSDMITNASDQIRTDIYSEFTPKFNVKSIIDGARLGQYNENPTLSSTLTGYSKGMQLRLWNDTTFAKLYISKLRTFFNHTGNVNVLVYDLTQAKLLDTIVVASIAGQIVETDVNKVYKSASADMNLAIMYDSTFQSYVSGFEGYGCVTCNRGGAYRQNKYLYSTGFTILNTDSKIQSSLNSSSDFGGLSLVYSLQCDHEAWICQNANFFVSAMLYKTAYLINHYAAYSSESFSSMNMDAERLKQRMEDFDFEYTRRLKAGIKNLRAPNSDACFACNRLIISKTDLPA